MREKSGNTSRQQTSCRGRESECGFYFVYINLSLFCPSSSLSICLTLIPSLSICLALSVSCSFSAICERAALCPRHINTQWPSQGLQQRAQVPFSVSLADFYSSPPLPHSSSSLSHFSPSESNCTFFKFYTSGENAVIFKKTTQKSKFLLYPLPSFLSAFYVSFPSLPSHLFILSPSTLFLSLKISHVFLSPPPAPCLSSSPPPILCTCRRIYHSWAPFLFSSYFSLHNYWMPQQNALYTQTYLGTGLARPIKGIVHQKWNFCHDLFTAMLFQTCITFFLWNTKGHILKNLCEKLKFKLFFTLNLFHQWTVSLNHSDQFCELAELIHYKRWLKRAICPWFRNCCYSSSMPVISSE